MKKKTEQLLDILKIKPISTIEIRNLIHKRLCPFDLGSTGFFSGKKPG